MKAVFSIALLTFFGLTVLSQGRKIDSLQNLLAKTTVEDTNKVLLLDWLTRAFEDAGQYKNAIETAKQTKALSEKLNYYKGISFSCNNIGVNAWYLGNYPEALRYHFINLGLMEKTGNKRGIAIALTNIGLVYYDQGDYKTAAEKHRKALIIRTSLADSSGMAASFSNLGMACNEMHDYPSALENYFSALRYDEALGDKLGISIDLNNLGNTFRSMDNYPEAEKYLGRALNYFRELSNKEGVAASYVNLGQVMLKEKKFDEAGIVLRKGLEIALEIDHKQWIRSAYRYLVPVDSSKGNWKQALSDYQLYTRFSDSLVNEENTKKTVRQQMQYEFSKKQAADSVKVSEEKKVATAELRSEQNQRYSLYGGLVLVLAFAGAMYNRFRLTQKQKAVIEEQKIVVEEQKKIVEEKNKDILDSIHYARRIQRALMPAEKYFQKKLPKN